MALILHHPMQDRAANSIVVNAASPGDDSSLTSVNSEDISTDTGPGGQLPRAFNATILTSIPDMIALFEDGFSIAANAEAHMSIHLKRDDEGSFHAFAASASENQSEVYFLDSNGELAIRDDSEIIITLDPEVSGMDWHHYAFNFNANGSVDLYVDGIFNGSFSGNRLDSLNISRLLLDAVAARPFQGLAAGFRYYNNKLTAPQILADYTADLSSDEEPWIRAGGGYYAVVGSQPLSYYKPV
jgi:hypothetical protein